MDFPTMLFLLRVITWVVWPLGGLVAGIIAGLICRHTNTTRRDVLFRIIMPQWIGWAAASAVVGVAALLVDPVLVRMEFVPQFDVWQWFGAFVLNFLAYGFCFSGMTILLTRPAAG